MKKEVKIAVISRNITHVAILFGMQTRGVRTESAFVQWTQLTNYMQQRHDFLYIDSVNWQQRTPYPSQLGQECFKMAAKNIFQHFFIAISIGLRLGHNLMNRNCRHVSVLILVSKLIRLPSSDVIQMCVHCKWLKMYGCFAYVYAIKAM